MCPPLVCRDYAASQSNPRAPPLPCGPIRAAEQHRPSSLQQAYPSPWGVKEGEQNEGLWPP